MRFLILGSGGREHVFAWKLSQSHHQPIIYVAPGNAGTAAIATNVNLSALDFEAIGDFCMEHKIDIVLPGNEDPLVMGIVDYFQNRNELKNIFVFGPTKSLARLEGSKDFAKEFMLQNNIPTATHKTFTKDEFDLAKNHLDNHEGPYVLKADGLAAGKGVVITNDREEAKLLLREMMVDGKFGEACDKLVIEHFLNGPEFSVFALSDGENYCILPVAKDYKRIGENDQGLNTGGMGAVSPVPFVTEEMMLKVKEKIIVPTFDGFKRRNEPYIGFVFFGLINVKGEPMVIEYNARMGDPETEVVFPRIENDFVEILGLAKNKRLNNVLIREKSGFCTTVFAVSGGYPEDYSKNLKIEIQEPQDGILFHAGTKINGSDIITSGGRVIASTAFGADLSSSLNLSYENLKGVKFEKMYYRKDIGNDLKRNQNGNS